MTASMYLAFQQRLKRKMPFAFVEYDIPLTIPGTRMLSQGRAVVQNPSNRCYYCKTVIFTEIQKKTRNLVFLWQTEQMRPMMQTTDRGMKALQELKVSSRHAPRCPGRPPKPVLRDESKNMDYLPRANRRTPVLQPDSIRYGSQQKRLRDVEQAGTALTAIGF